MKPTELKGKTIFDFTSDDVLIFKINGLNSHESEAVANYKKNATADAKAADIACLANLTGNTELKEAATALLDQLEAESESEAAKNPGVVID